MSHYLKNILLFLIFLFVFPCIYSQEKVYPRNGEGITLLLKRYDRQGRGQYRRFVELNKRRLGANNMLLKGVAYTLPPKISDVSSTTPATTSTQNIPAEQTASKSTGKTRREPLFGTKLAEYTVQSDELNGATFYLVSGHGGPDPGAIGKVGNHSLHEDEYAYDIILRLARNLLMKGAKVHIIIQDAKDGIRDEEYLSNSKRETCMGAPIPLNQVKRLQQRSNKINSLYAKNPTGYHRAVFVHLDSRSKSKKMDVFFYYAEGSRMGERLAIRMRSLFQSKYDRHQPGRGFSGTINSRGLYVLNNTKPVALFVELGNIQNASDQRRFIQSSNRQALANWMCEGFVKDYKAQQTKSSSRK